MANFTDVGLDLQNVMRRTYANLLYRSTFFNFLNEQYILDKLEHQQLKFLKTRKQLLIQELKQKCYQQINLTQH